jgi:hypothetical protein
MFLAAYVALTLVAALPLLGTLSRGRNGDPYPVFLHRLYRDLIYVGGAVLAIICFETALTISLQNYWFGELGQAYRYWLTLGLRWAIFLAILLLVGVFVGYNLRALCRPLPAVPKSAPWLAAFILAALLGFAATALWVPLLSYLGATSTGTVDPVFGRDLSFYLLALPWYYAVIHLVIAILVITIALWAAIGFGCYPSSGQPWNAATFRLGGRNRRSLRVIDPIEMESWAQGEAVWQRWLRQGLILAGLLCVAMGLARFLGRYYLIMLDIHRS